MTRGKARVVWVVGLLLSMISFMGAAAAPAAPPGERPLAAADSAVPLAAESLAAVPLAAVPSAAAESSRFRWPLDGEVRVTRAFDPPVRRWLPGHRGVDLATSPGAFVRAAGDGVVRFAGPVGGKGAVSVDHAGGLRTTYEPVAPLVTVGERVRAGDPLGVLDPGHAGCAVPACLHWGLRRGELYLDPLTLLGVGRARLLPGP